MRRSRLAGPIRSETVAPEELTRAVMSTDRIQPEDSQLLDDEAPKTRGECGTMRPCPWVRCKHNAYLDVTHKGSLKHNFPGLGPDGMAESCTLDVADRGPQTLEEVAAVLNLTREGVRQIEQIALRQLRRRKRRLG